MRLRLPSSSASSSSVRVLRVAARTPTIALVGSTPTLSGSGTRQLRTYCHHVDTGTMHEVGIKFGHTVDVVTLELLLSREADERG